MHSLVYFSTMAYWLTTTLCLFFHFTCVWSGVIHTDAAVDVEHDLTVDPTNDPLLNIPDGKISKTTSEPNVTSSVFESVTDSNVSGKLAATDKTLIFNQGTTELSAKLSDSVKEVVASTSTDTFNTFGSAEGETVIDKKVDVPVLVEPDVIGNDTTQTTTGIKSTQKFSSQIPSDSPMPTLSPVTNSSLVVKESVTMADAEKSDNTASPNVEVNSSNANIPTDMQITVVEETRIASGDPLNSDTSIDATEKTNLKPFTPPTVNADIVQDLTVLSNTTDGFDLIMDSTIDSSINVGNVQFDANSTIHSKAAPSVVMVSGDPEVTSAGELNLDSGASTTIQSSADSAIEPLVSSTLRTIKANDDSSTVSPLETLLFETNKETTLSTTFPSTSDVTQAGSSLSTALDSISETTTSGENLINPPIQTIEQFTAPAVTFPAATNLSLQLEDKSATRSTESDMLTTTVNVLPSTSSQALSTEAVGQPSTKNQMEGTESVDQSTPTVTVVKSEVSVPKPEKITETTTLSKTSTIMQRLVEATESGISSLLTTPERKVTTDETRKSTTSETPSLVGPTSEKTTTEATTPRETVENTAEIAVHTTLDNSVQTSKPVTTTIKATSPQPTTTYTVETTGRMTTNKDTSEVKTTVVTTTSRPMIITSPTTTTAATTTRSPTTTTTAAVSTVSTTERPCPVYESKYRRNDLIVTTEPAGCTMISKIVDVRGQFRGPKRMIWRKMHAGLRGLRYPSVSFNYAGTDDVSDETCQMPTKSVGPYIVVDTIPGRCQMVIGLRSVRAPVNKNITPGMKGSPRRAFRFRLVMRPVVEYLEDTLL